MKTWLRVCPLDSRSDPLFFFFFYTQPVKDDETNVIFVKDISPDEARDVCNTWKRHGHVINFLPLLKKVQTQPDGCFQRPPCRLYLAAFESALCWSFSQAFLHFSSCLDADRFGVWHSLKQCCGSELYRQRVPRTCPSETDFQRAAGKRLSEKKERGGKRRTRVDKDGVPLLFLRRHRCCCWNHHPAGEFRPSRGQYAAILDYNSNQQDVSHSISLVHRPRWGAAA